MLPILNQSFWRDEAFSVLLSKKSPLNIILLTAKDQSPPLYSLLLHYWMALFGTSEVAVRTLSFIFHIATVIVIFFLIRKLTKSVAAQIVISTSVLLNPFLLQYAFEARTYSLLAFLTTVAVYCITQKKYILAGIALALSILSHNFGIFNTAAIFFWWIYTNKHHVKSAINNFISLFFFPTLALLGWGTVIWNQWVRVGGGFWIKQATSAVFLDTLRIYTQGDITYPTASLLQLVSFILFIVSMTYWVWKKEKETTPTPLLMASIALLPLCITYIISALFVPIYHERYLIASLPMLITLAGYGVYKLFQEFPTKRLFITVLVSCYMILLVQSSEQILALKPKPPINWAVSQVLQQAKPGDIIVPKDVLNFLETKFYAENNSKHIPVFAYTPTRKIPFYIGAVLFEPKEIIASIPLHTRVWEIEPDGGYKLLPSKTN